MSVPRSDRTSLKEMANAIRILSVDAVEAAQSGHPGMPLGMADIATVLFSEVLKYDASAPDWPDRDRFVLSNGHGSMLQYSLLHLTGYAGMPLEEIKRFRQLESRATGHPERGEPAGVETTTGPLGQGLATAVGMALAERLLAARWGPDLVDHRIYVFCGDGCLMEGVAQEAISLAGHLGLSNLTLVFDDNSTTIDGSTALSTSERHLDRFRAANWDTIAIDGHDIDSIRSAFTKARDSEKPVVIAAKTRIGFGAPTKEGKSIVHGAPLGPEEVAGLRKGLGWGAEPFHVPDEIMAAWRACGARGADSRRDWEERLSGHPRKDAFMDALSGALPDALDEAMREEIQERLAHPKDEPTRASGRRAAGAIFNILPERLFGGSGDLTSSVLSLAEGMTPIAEAGFSGQHMTYGVREHAMAAAMNGIAAHGGLVPYGATYLTFSDYCRPAIRLAAMMKLRVIFVFTHDSIGVGEDGPTHQPIEQVLALRAIPGLTVYRPADAVETAECWLDAVRRDGPSAMILSRQKTPQLRHDPAPDMPARRGGYVLAEADGPRDATLLATGTEVALAMDARKRLADQGVALAVVSVPSWELFDRLADETREAVLGCAPRFAVEAGSRMGWSDYVGSKERVFGLDNFGLSAPGPKVFEATGLTAERVAKEIAAQLGR